MKGVKKFKHCLSIKDYHVPISCFGRSKVCFITKDLSVAVDKVSKGWLFSKIKDGFWMQAPEIWLADISEPVKATLFSNNLVKNLAYFLYLKSKSDKQLTTMVKEMIGGRQEVFISKGKSIDLEIRVILEDKNSGCNLALDLYSDFIQSSEYSKFLRISEKIISNGKKIKLRKNKKISDYPPNVSRFFSEIVDYYSLINMGNKDLYSHDFIPKIRKEVDDHFNFTDIFIFIPWSCFKYIGNFISEKNVNKVMLWETHLFKHDNHEHIFKGRNLKGKKVLIFDKSYTGGTLNKMAKLVKNQGGHPIKVAIFPKSRLGIKNSDYIFFLDRLIKSSEIDTSKNDYYLKLYQQFF